QAMDAAKAAAKEHGTGLSQLKKRSAPADSGVPITFKKPRPRPCRPAKKEESQAFDGAHPDEDEQAVDKPSPVVDLVSKSRSGGHQTEPADPLAGISASVRSQIPEDVARRARLSGGKFYSNVVHTYQASSGSSSYSPRHPKAIIFPIAKVDKGKGAAIEEDERIPATPHYSSRDRAAICRKVFKAVPREYVASLSGRTDAQFGAIQASLLDLFCRMEFCKSWKTRTAEELNAQVAESVHHGDYAFKTIEEVRLEMQTTIDLQAKELATLKSNKADLLKKLEEYPQVKEETGQAECLQGELETARSQIHALKECLHDSYAQGEQAAKDAVKHSWEKHMEASDLAWFQRRLEHSVVVLAAERLGMPPPDLLSASVSVF
ncbi:hypothetical protein SOVF_099230, partial [Spinacia oleracea]